jgi:murein DD-endopeptidase MepM/ murein hydrolase activator NlpD
MAKKKKKKAAPISPFVGWSVSLAQNKDKVKPKNFRKEYYNPTPGHAAYTGTRTQRTAVRDLYNTLKKSPKIGNPDPQTKSWKAYSRMWNPKDVVGSMDKVQANYDTADELSKFMYTILRASQGFSTEKLDDAKDGKMGDETHAPAAGDYFTGKAFKDTKFKDDIKDDRSTWDKIQHGGQSFLNKIDEGVEHVVPAYKAAKDAADTDYFKEGMERTLDVLSRPLFAAAEATRQMNRKDKDGKSPWSITGTDPVHLATDTVRGLLGKSPSDAIDDMKPGDYKDVAKGAWRGFTGKEKTTYARVIADNAARDNQRTIHDKRAYQIAAGLTADLAGDPLNFVGVGVVRAPVRAKNALEDRKVFNLAKDLARQEIPKPGGNELYSPTELYHAIGGRSTKNSGLQKSRSVENVIENIDHIRGHLKTPLVATHRGVNKQAHKLYNLEKRGKRQVAKRDAELERHISDYEAGKLSSADAHQMDIITEEARRSVGRMIAKGEIPVDDSVESVLRVATAKKAIANERFYRKASKAVEEEELKLVALRKKDTGTGEPSKALIDQEGRVAEARRKLGTQRTLEQALGPSFANNPRLPQEFKDTVLDDLNSWASKHDPKYSAARKSQYTLYNDVKKLRQTVSNMHRNGAPAAEIKKAETALKSLEGQSSRAFEQANTQEASLLVRRVEHYLQNEGKDTFTDSARGQQLTEELTRITDELASQSDQSYTGMSREDYDSMLADEVSDYVPEGDAEVPFGRKADLENRLRHLTGKNHDEFLQDPTPRPGSALAEVTTKVNPLEDISIEAPEGFRLTEPNGELSAAAKEHIDFRTDEGGRAGFVVHEDAPEWAQKLATTLDERFRKSLKSRMDSDLRVKRADRKNTRDRSDLTETRQMFGAPEGKNTDLTGMVQGPNGPVYAGRYSDDLVQENDTKVFNTFENHLKLSKENFDKGAEVSPVLRKRAKTLHGLLRSLNFHPPVGTDNFVKWLMDDDVYAKIMGKVGENPAQSVEAALSPKSIAFAREFRKQHGVSYADAIIKRDKELGRVLKWNDKSRWAGQELTKQEAIDMLMSGDNAQMIRVLTGNALDFKVPAGELARKGGNYTYFKNAAKKAGGDWKQAESAYLEAAKNFIRTEPQKAVQEISSGWTRSFNKQGRLNTAPEQAVKAKAVDYDALTPEQKRELTATYKKKTLQEVGDQLHAGTLKHKSTQFSEATLLPHGQADDAAIKAALRDKQAEQIAEAKLIPNFEKRQAAIKSLRENHAKERAAYVEAFERAKNSRKLLLKRLDEDFLLRAIEAEVQAPRRRLSVQTWGDTDLFSVPGSETLFAAANKLGNLPIIKQTRQVFADAFTPPSGVLPRELTVARNRAMGNTPQIIAQHFKEMKATLGKFHESERVNSFKAWRDGAKVGRAGDDIDSLMQDLLPYFQGEFRMGQDNLPLTIGDINRYLPSHLQVLPRNIHEVPKTPQRLIEMMEAGGKYARKEAGTRKEVKAFPKDPMDVVWETRLAVEQASARKALVDVINSFGVRRKQFLEDGKLVPVDAHELVEDLGTKHGWKTMEDLDTDYGIPDTHYFPPEVMPDVQNLLDLMEPHNITSFGRMVDEITGIYKAGATMYNPGYYTRNAIGEAMSSWFDGVKSVKPYRRAQHMGRYMRNEGAELEALKSHIPAMAYVPSTTQSDLAKKTAAVLRNGHKVNIEEATVLYFDQGLKTGFFNTERKTGKFSHLAQKLSEGKVTGAPGKMHTKIREKGEGWEDHFRMAHFLDAMEKAPKGLNARQAAEWAADKVRKFHFDYTDFTQFEKTVMLRAFPFYKWTRKAAPLMMTMLFTKPGKVMAYPKIMNSASMGVSSQDLTEEDPNGFMPNYEGIVPEWMKDMWAYKIDEDSASESYFNMATPQMDIYKQVGDPLGTASMLANPLAKVPYEQITGESFPGGNMDLEYDTGQKRFNELARQFPTTNYLNKELQGKGNEQNRFSWLTGLGVYRNDDESKRMELDRQGLLENKTKAEEMGATPGDTKKPTSSPERMRQLVDTMLRSAFREEKAKEGKDVKKEEEDKWVLQGFKGMEAPLKAQFRISTNFGPRTHPITGKPSNHTGVDLAADGGSAIYAPNDGTVVYSGWDDVYGNKIIVDFGNGKKSMFGHLDSSKVNYGQRIRRGDTIGYVGSTGLSTGPHLHWETWDHNVPTNPMNFLGGG